LLNWSSVAVLATCLHRRDPQILLKSGNRRLFTKERSWEMIENKGEHLGTNRNEPKNRPLAVGNLLKTRRFTTASCKADPEILDLVENKEQTRQCPVEYKVKMSVRVYARKTTKRPIQTNPDRARNSLLVKA
jgi:hypothetical protein